VSFGWDPVTVNLYGRLTLDDAFNLVGGMNLNSNWGTQSGIEVLVEPIFGDVDFSLRFNQYWNNLGFRGATIGAELSGPITDYLDFTIGADAAFNQNFNFTGGSVVLGLEKDSEFHSGHTFVSALEFNFIAGPGSFGLDYIEWQNDFNLVP